MSLRSIWRPIKDEVVADRGAVVASHPLAAEAGVAVLRGGGNAVDAAVAMGFCSAVVEPMSSCIAGHGQMLIHMTAGDGTTVGLDFSHRAPKAATAGMYRVLGQVEEGNGIYEVEGRANVSGYLSVGVPGLAAGLCRAHEVFGSLSLEQLLDPAIHYAQEGFSASWLTTLCIAEAMPDFLRYREAAKIFLPGGCPPQSGKDPVVQRDLAQVLRRIACRGAQGLYQGEIPEAVEEDMKKNGGLLRSEDFADYHVQLLEPARLRYRGYEIVGLTGPDGGATVLQILNIMERLDPGRIPHNSPRHLHLFIEAARHAFADRYRYLGDPDFVPVPLPGLLSDSYAREVAAAIDPHRARLAWERKQQPWVAFGGQALHDPWPHEGIPRPETAPPVPPSGGGDCTTHFGVIDRDRNLVACTQTAAGSFGSRVITPGTGLLFSNAMVVFNPLPGTPNSIAGYKRGLCNMAPLLVLREGKPFLSLGASGGRRIICCNTQVVMNAIDYGMSIQQALAVPRVDAAERETWVDARMSEETAGALAQMGHNVARLEESAAYQAGFARPAGLMVHPQTGRIHAGVDVFRMGEARGF